MIWQLLSLKIISHSFCFYWRTAFMSLHQALCKCSDPCQRATLFRPCSPYSVFLVSASLQTFPFAAHVWCLLDILFDQEKPPEKNGNIASFRYKETGQTLLWKPICMLENLLREETEMQGRGRRENERWGQRASSRKIKRERKTYSEREGEGVRENFLPLAVEMVLLSCPPCLDLKLCLLARPGVHVWS